MPLLLDHMGTALSLWMPRAWIQNQPQSLPGSFSGFRHFLPALQPQKKTIRALLKTPNSALRFFGNLSIIHP
jgi:hypothetical protein